MWRSTVLSLPLQDGFPAKSDEHPSLAQGPDIEIGLEQVPLLLLFIFSSFEHAKNLLIMGPNNTKNSSKSLIFLIFNYE